MPPLVFVIRHLPAPARSGALIRSERLLNALSRDFECVLVFPYTPTQAGMSPDHEPLEVARETMPSVDLVPVADRILSRRQRQLRSLGGRRSAEFGMGVTSPLRRAVAREVQRRRPSIVHYDDVTAALTGPVANTTNVFAPHNVEYRILLETAAHTSGARAAFAAFDGRRLRREELRLWRAMDVCVAVSQIDAQTMRENGARRVLLCPNGTDAVPRLPPRRLGENEALRILFVGAGSYEPNRRGLMWLIDEVLPHVGAVRWKLDVVGTPPGVLPGRPGVEYHDQVVSVDGFYEAAHVAVVPILYGSGTRLKVIEALARGRPLISTGAGAEGLGLVAGRDYLRADQPAQFAGLLESVAASLRGRGESLEPMLVSGRRAAEPMFWPVLGEKLAASYLKLSSD